MDDGKRRMFLRVILMCYMVIPFWVAQSIGMHLGSWAHLILFGPIIAGAYAGAVSRTYLSAIIACLLTASLSAVGMTAVEIFRYLFSEAVYVSMSGVIGDLLLLPTLFIYILGLQVVGVVPPLVVRELHGGGASGSSSQGESA